ncbi:PD-(D/E)XK motif protein [Galbibacter sp. PAP.153]|uniref:PD-(D/E)XK motif protein n=1 Tax=Galbibacter sp. PAP.153 TaxID=3104623 RepID=UPI003008F958
MTTRKKMKIDLKKIWRDQESYADNHVMRERIHALERLQCFVGTVGFTGARMFQLELDASTPVHKNYLHRFKGVDIHVLPKKDEQVNEFTIILNDRDLMDIFTLFIEDILEKLNTVENEKDALVCINQRVGYWKKLFARASGEMLSPQKQRGLFGELYILRLLLEQMESKRYVLNGWVGSSNANQDFAFDNNALEVKTSKAGNPTVNISNEHQLDFTNWNHIFLTTVLVNESSGNEGTLVELINDIQSLLQEDMVLLHEFHLKLDLAGMDKDTIDQYDEISYTVRSCRFYHVREGFPVIIRATMDNDWISNVKYQIDIGQCKTFEVEEPTVLDILL